MCKSLDEWYQCYECQKKFNYKKLSIPCFQVENGQACRGIKQLEPVIQVWENCDSCKAARTAEEISTRRVHRQEPMYYKQHRNRAALRITYCQHLAEGKKRVKKQQEKKEKKEKREAQKALGLDVSEFEEETDEELETEDRSPATPAPPLITMRHQSNTP
ncbi:hypothetical protein F5B20DRAFT_593391 [Whalleya microplaca]|nr:hypothetical protein F5B20DRAFT_593391 [Whalleya microplaca]